MERPLIIGERIMFANGDSPVNCVFAIRVKGQVNLERLENALSLVQRKHALLRATIHTNKGKNPRFVFHEELADIPIRIVERTSDHKWMEEVQKEWMELFPFEKGPLARLVWVKSEQCSELILVCPHVVCDGTTFVTLIQEMLKLMDDPSYDPGTSEPFISLEKLLPEVDWNKRNLTYILLKPVLQVVLKGISLIGKKNKGKPYMMLWSLTEEETSALVTKCKSENVSVHTTLCYATLSAFKKVKGNRSKDTVISPADIRRFISGIKSDTMFAFAPVIDLSLKKSKTSDFWGRCHELQEDLIEKLNQMEIVKMLTKGEYLNDVAPNMVNFIKTNPGSHAVTLSNMGRLAIPEHFRTFEVDTIWSPTVAFPWRNPNTLVISTFKGQMNFSFTSNTDFLSEPEAESIKQSIMEILNDQIADRVATPI